ncbi:nitroreductase family protein [Ligilactobacillus animalis]|uniref:nitroreductase family protein n=1 Tax=Ligilactobacillus animalis TaxID=1605 RepID=UPI0024319E97|nr:nitroreductase family protein [Ligilactobacillus animalis]MDY2993227.1 nitroreductase family protein [Ligilactobacillus animalis]
MDFTALVQKRHSTRDFSDQVIPRSQLEQIIQDALTTPSWVNSQPWRVYVATGKTLALIKEKHRETVKQGDLGTPNIRS